MEPARKLTKPWAPRATSTQTNTHQGDSPRSALEQTHTQTSNTSAQKTPHSPPLNKVSNTAKFKPKTKNNQNSVKVEITPEKEFPAYEQFQVKTSES